MTLDTIVAEVTEVPVEKTYSFTPQLEAQTEAITALTETISELVEKIHDLERSVAYSLGER